MALIIDYIFHLDQHLVSWIAFFGPWTYVIMFLVIFCETGLVITPFLPGDSLLFALGALTSIDNGLNLWIILVSLTLAGIMGDTVNYHIGKLLGSKVFERNSGLFKTKYLEETQAFFSQWGSFTIVAARFAPIIRTFAPFIAGIGTMNYKRFLSYNIIGSVAWVSTFTLAGHFFGNFPIVKRNFHVVIFGVIFVSLMPIILPWIKSRFGTNGT
jgi:membrane-associated protein